MPGHCRVHLKRPYTITKMNENMDSTIAGPSNDCS